MDMPKTYSVDGTTPCQGVHACAGNNHCHCWWSTITVTQDPETSATCCCGAVESYVDRALRLIND